MAHGYLKNMLYRLLERNSLAFPLNSKVNISIEKAKRIISLSMPIFVPLGPMPRVITDYVLKRHSHRFKPHSTYFEIAQEEIHLKQEISYTEETNISLRHQVQAFYAMAQKCHTMLKEIALEENSKNFRSDIFKKNYDE